MPAQARLPVKLTRHGGAFVHQSEAGLQGVSALTSAARIVPDLPLDDVALAGPPPCDRSMAALEAANEQLRLDVQHARALQALAEDKQARQTRYLAELAHELRNPLAVIRTASALMGRAHSGVSQLPRLRCLIDQQVAQMTRFVGDLLDVSRVSTGKLRVERSTMDLAVVLADVIEARRPAMDARLQCFTVELPAGPLPMDGDATRLTQVLNNLLDNASKYTPTGGGVSLVVRRSAASLTLSVSDTGIGITETAIASIFEPFVQDEHAVGFNGAGLGLGLTVVRELVEGHGGTVVASSAGKGLGSCFVVTLPAHAAPQAA